MAASSKSTEIKDRWLELANHWRRKANDCGGQTEAAAEPSPQPIGAVTSPDISGQRSLSGIITTRPPVFQNEMMVPNIPVPSQSASLRSVSNTQLPIKADDDVSPSLSPSLHEVSKPQPEIDKAADEPQVIELDDEWKRVLADIRGR